jgi:hypothetical protein
MSRTSKRRAAPSSPDLAQDNPAQSDRFIATAQAVQAHASPEIFEQAFQKVAFGKLTKRSRDIGPVDKLDDRPLRHGKRSRE